ncbi:hypothetical protein C2S51_003325 [Perilla frutescens var. frutescens]|nr:hypothetical protein C2S51_003325 [Perilla frutescens var. frutescens]
MDQFYVATLSVSMLVISVIIYMKLILKTGGHRRPSPPGPRGLPVVGYLPFLGDNLLHDFKDLEQKYGPIFKLHLGHKLYTVISSPPLVKEVVRDHDAVFANRDTPVAVTVATFGGNDIAWSPHNSEWRAMRKIFVQEMMSSRSFDESYHLRREEIRKVIKHIYDGMIGKATEMGDLCFPAELNVLINMSWGGTVAGELGERVAAEVRAVVAKIADLVGKPNVSDYYPFLAWLDVQGIKRQMENYVESLDKILDVVIAEHTNELAGAQVKRERRDYLQILLELNDEGDRGTSKITRKQLKAILMDVVAGGADTSATVEWAMAELMNNPEVMATAQKELNDVVGLNKIVEESHTPELKYLEAVVKETLRLHPPVPLLVPRSPSRSSTIGGYTIPEGSGVFINIWSIQRDPSIWDMPMEFNPQRFLHGHYDYSGNQFQYLPFGSGRRICAGRALSERMILYLLASLLHSFDWRLPQGGDDDQLDMSETYGLVLRKSTPLIVIPTPRLPDSTFYM